ncbi:hypothetical protein pipiens_014973 [Culex pipiens pipiens]|uniref:Secreted protein n=1 Tax=Culex pipiens pipiens TaxID=38569 RepID=A0ABD1CSX8_CULPP
MVPLAAGVGAAAAWHMATPVPPGSGGPAANSSSTKPTTNIVGSTEKPRRRRCHRVNGEQVNRGARNHREDLRVLPCRKFRSSRPRLVDLRQMMKAYDNR